MVKHIVMWKLKEEAEGYSKKDNLQRMKNEILKLKEIIPQIKYYEVGIDFLHTPASFDIILLSAFESKVDLKSYREHPEHKAVVEFVNKLVTERYVVDYELE